MVMDNILKILLGVLGLAALIAMLVPSENPVAPSSPAPIAAPAPSSEVPPVPQNPVSPTIDAPAQEPSDDLTIGPIGEPTIDGTPLQKDFGYPIGTQPPSSSPDGNMQNGEKPKGDYDSRAIAPTPGNSAPVT
jgi:hypothetical protein